MPQNSVATVIRELADGRIRVVDLTQTLSPDFPMIELPQDVHPWFVACQFHPEFTSNPRAGHPLFKAYIEAAIAHKEGKK